MKTVLSSLVLLVLLAPGLALADDAATDQQPITGDVDGPLEVKSAAEADDSADATGDLMASAECLSSAIRGEMPSQSDLMAVLGLPVSLEQIAADESRQLLAGPSCSCQRANRECRFYCRSIGCITWTVDCDPADPCAATCSCSDCY